MFLGGLIASFEGRHEEVIRQTYRAIESGFGDPEAFYQPWSTRVRDQRGKEPFIAEEICAENNLNSGLFDFHMPVATKPDF